jgi:hypothetical protein
MFVVAAPLLVPLAIWIYTLVFAFSSLWFAHFTLDALEQLRKKNSAADQTKTVLAAPELIVDKNLSTPELPPPAAHL